MSIAHEPLPRIEMPSHLDLPHTDDKPVQSDYQPLQGHLLTESLTPHLLRLHPNHDYYAAEDNAIYWKWTDPPERGCRAPDWFYVPGVPRWLEDGVLRRSYVMWKEHKSPLLIVEVVSGDGDGVEERDRTPNSGKFWVYEQAIKGLHYVIWEPSELTLEAYELVNGRYQRMAPRANGRIAIPRLDIELGPWDGVYQGLLPLTWLRCWDRNGLLRTGAERAEIEKQRADAERSRAETEARRVAAEKSRADAASRRADAADQRAAAEKSRAAAESSRADAADQRADAADQRAEAESSRAAIADQRAEAESSRAETEARLAAAEKSRAETEARRAEAEKLRADKLAAKLRELGIAPEQL